MNCEQMSSLHVPSVDGVLCSKPPRNALAISCLKFTRGYCATTLVRSSSGNVSYPIPSTSRPTPLYKSSTSNGLYAAIPGAGCRENASQAVGHRVGGAPRGSRNRGTHLGLSTSKRTDRLPNFLSE